MARFRIPKQTDLSLVKALMAIRDGLNEHISTVIQVQAGEQGAS